ncbi:MAG TPA: PIN domain-containing protein [Vicinamibacteria bacterium]|nr:PIN domain-containing protein [Vicinamibacteria bacterium]
MAAPERVSTVGIDTSVVLRLLVGSPPEQATAALTFVKRCRLTGRRVVVSDLVISEACFALHAHYAVPKSEAISALLEMLASGLVEPADGPLVAEVLERVRRAPAKPGFLDRLIHAQYSRVPAAMATFERAGKRLPGTTVLR